MLKRDDFRRVFNKAVRQAYGEGQISLRQAAALHLAVVLFRDQLEAFCVQQAVTAATLPPEAADKPGEIDWDALLEFLKELLPLILEFIEALLVIFA